MPISHVTEKDVPWTTAAHYPEALQQVVRWNTLIGAGAASWPGVPQKDVRMGVLELDAGGYYPGHAHPAPEIYFVLSGTAQWTVANETFEARPGMAIYHAPDVQHRMVNTGADVLRAVWFWWAPEGRSEMLEGEIDLLEPMPQIPKEVEPAAIPGGVGRQRVGASFAPELVLGRLHAGNIKHYSYRVTWSPEDNEHVASCAEFPSLSWLAKTPEAALKGIQKVLADTVADMESDGEAIPTRRWPK